MLPADQQLQRKRRTVDHFPPPALVLGLCHPCLPETHSLVEARPQEIRLGPLSSRANSPENEGRPFACSKPELRGHIPGFLSQRNSRIQRHRRTRVACRRKNRMPLFKVHGVPADRIVKPGLAPHLEINLSPDDGQGPHNLIRLLPVSPNRHVVRQLSHALVRKESREKNIRVRQIQLPHPPFLELWLNLKAPTSLVVQ